MWTPEFHDGFAAGKEDPIFRVKTISAWFRHVNATTPRLRQLRYAAIDRLRELGYTLPQIAEETGMSQHRLREIMKERNASASALESHDDLPAALDRDTESAPLPVLPGDRDVQAARRVD